MADCYLRKEIGSNVFKKMKDPAQSRYFNIMSSYYDTAWKYGIGQNAAKTKTYTPRGGAAGSGRTLPEDFQEQNKGSMDKLREQMGNGKAVDFFKTLADEKASKEDKEWATRGIAQLVQTENGKQEVTSILSSMFKGDDKKVADYLDYYRTYEPYDWRYANDKSGVPKSVKTEQADVYIQLKNFVSMPYLITDPYDKKIFESYLAKIETGDPILEKDLPKLQELIGKYNTPEALAKAAAKASGDENGFAEAVGKADEKIEKSLRELMEEVDKGGPGGGGAGQPSEEARAFAKATVEGLNDDRVLGQGLFASIMAVWNKEAPAIAPSAGQAIQDAGIFTPKTVGPITYNPITGMAGLSFLPDIPAMVISPITKTIFGYDAETGAAAKPTVGDWVSSILTFAGAAEARGVNVLGTARTTITDFFSSTSGKLGPGAKAGTKAAANAADDVAAVTKDSINKAFINDLNKVQHTYESIGTKNYPSYITESGKKFSSMDDVVSYLSAKRDIALSSLDDMAKESTKINNYVNTAKTMADDVLKEGGKYSDDFWTKMEQSMARGTGSALEDYGVAKVKTGGFISHLPESIQGPAKTVAAIGPGYLALLGAVGFGGFLVLDDQMQFDEFPITNGLENGNFASAAAAMAADQHKHNTWQFGTALLAELVTLPFAAIDKATGLQTQHNLPVVGQVITTYLSYEQRGERAAQNISRYGLWQGDFLTGRPSTREEIVDWYDKNKNDKTLFPNPPTKDTFNEVQHSYYKSVAENKNYDQEVKQVSYMGTTPLEKLLGKDDKQGGGGAGSPKGFGAMTGLGVGQSSPGVIPGKSISDRINTLLGDKTLDSFQIKTLGETFKIPGVDQLNNLLSSDKIQEAKEYLTNKLAEVVPGYKPYEKSAWKTPGANYSPDRSGICLSACQAACQSAQVFRNTSCGATQFSAFNVGSGSGGGDSVLLCGGGEAHGGGDCREYGCEATAESRAILCGEGGSCGSKQVVGCAACESAAEVLPQLKCGESSTPQPSCGYDLSGYNVGCSREAGGLPTENKGSQGGSVPMEYCSGGAEVCSQSESCDSSDIAAAESACQGCETVWQMGCMSKELGMRKKK